MRKNYTFKTFINGEVDSRLSSHSIRRFLNHLRSFKSAEGIEKVYLRVSYGKHKDVSGETTTFYNNGLYKNEKDLIHAFKAFNELKPINFVVKEGGDFNDPK